MQIQKNKMWAKIKFFGSHNLFCVENVQLLVGQTSVIFSLLLTNDAADYQCVSDLESENLRKR